MDEDKKKYYDKIKATEDNFNVGYLEAPLGYKFRTRDFMNVVFLYTNSVDVKNPDILGIDNRNTFIFEPLAAIEKIKEQVRLDIKDLNFSVPNASSMATFIVKAANRKMLDESDFDVVMDEIPDNAVEYGSGFLKVWTVKGKLKMKSIDPYMMIFNQYDFKNGIKIEKFRRTIRDIIEDDKYDEEPRNKLKQKTLDEKLDDFITLNMSVQDLPDGTQRVTITDFDNELMYYDYETKSDGDKAIRYYKFDAKKRKGFPDALGVGYVERVFNKIVQSKVNRERLDKVLDIASKLPFQKLVDSENDNYVGKEITELETGVILGHKGNPIEPMNTGGDKQIALLQNQINGIIQTISQDLNVGEALQGNTLPSGTSGVLGNLLTENASSVLKEVKKDLAKFYSHVYKNQLIDYLLKVYDNPDDMRKYLDAADVRLVEQGVMNYIIALKQVNAAIRGEEFNLAQATLEAKEAVKKEKLIPTKELLQSLKKEVEGIRPYISGEETSKAQTVAFLREMRTTYATNPQLFQSPFFISLLKKEAEFDSGVSGVEIDNLLRELKDQPVAPPATGQLPVNQTVNQ